MKFGEDINQHLRDLHRSRIYDSEGLIVAHIDGQRTDFEDGQSGRQLVFDGVNGLVRTESDKLLIPTLEKHTEDDIRFIGLTIMDEKTIVPHKPSHAEPLLTEGFKRPWACRREHFTEEAWQVYKTQIRKKQATILSTVGAGVTALSITAAVGFKRKKSK